MLGQIFNKIKVYREFHGSGETVYWLGSRVSDKLKQKLRGTQEIPAKAPAAYAAVQSPGVQWPDYWEYLLTEEEHASVLLKSSKQVFLFADAPYYAMGGSHDCAQLARALNKVGLPVAYFYGRQTGEPNLTIAPAIPCVRHIPLQALTQEAFAAMVRPGDLVLLQAAVPGYGNVAAKAGAHVADISALPKGVDDEIFAAKLEQLCPADLIPGRKTLVCYGDYPMDWSFVQALAEADASLSIHIIGNHNAPALPENVHLLGGKKYTQLPAYLKHADIALVPCAAADIPAVLYEAIAMHKPVLTTTSQCAGFPNVTLCSTAAEAMAAMETAAVDAEAAEAFVTEHTWAVRVQNILDGADPEAAQRCPEAYYGNVSVILLNYNNKNIIDKSVASLLRFNSRYGYEVVVVDNCSKDGSYEQLQARFGHRITLVRNSKNGCSSGRNLGVHTAKNKYILFLDSDQWVTGSHWLDAYLDVHANAGNFGAVSWAGGWFNKYGSATTETDRFPHRYMPPAGLCRRDIGYLGTGGFFMEKDLFLSFDGFDEAYDPTCYEDTDLSLNIRHVGKELYYCPLLGVVHLPHQTTKGGSDAHTRLIYTKEQYFRKKWKQRNPALLQYIKKL